MSIFSHRIVWLTLVHHHQVGQPRTREETLRILDQQISDIVAGVPTRVETAQTETGIKDRHFTPLFEKLKESISSRRTQNQQAGLESNHGVGALIEEIMDDRDPEDFLNPAFFIDGNASHSFHTAK